MADVFQKIGGLAPGPAVRDALRHVEPLTTAERERVGRNDQCPRIPDRVTQGAQHHIAAIMSGCATTCDAKRIERRVHKNTVAALDPGRSQRGHEIRFGVTGTIRIGTGPVMRPHRARLVCPLPRPHLIATPTMMYCHVGGTDIWNRGIPPSIRPERMRAGSDFHPSALAGA